MKIFVAADLDRVRDAYFPPHVMEALCQLGEVRLQAGRALDEDALIAQLGDADVLLSHWGTPRVTQRVLDACPGLSIIAHATGSVAGICSEAVYDRGIPVISANAIMCKYVAEAILGYMIAGTRHIVQYNAAMKSGESWPLLWDTSLFDARIAFIGLGMVGRRLLDMLAPFAPSVYVYDPYITDEALAPWPFARRASLHEAMRGASIVSLHASKTPETYHLVDAEALSLLPDGAVVVNAARGAVMDTRALEAELLARRLFAVLDVYEAEPLALDSPLRGMENVTLMPHKAGIPARSEMTQAIIDDLSRHLRGEPFTLEISRAQFRLMTQA